VLQNNDAPLEPGFLLSETVGEVNEHWTLYLAASSGTVEDAAPEKESDENVGYENYEEGDGAKDCLLIFNDFNPGAADLCRWFCLFYSSTCGLQVKMREAVCQNCKTRLPSNFPALIWSTQRILVQEF